MEHIDRSREVLATYTSDLNRSTVWAAIAGLFILVLATNYFQTSTGVPPARDGRPARPREHPYLIPFVGHAPQFIACREWFLNRLRGLYPEGIFSIRLFGRLHSIVFSPALRDSILGTPRSTANNDFLTPLLLRSTFGVSKSGTDAYCAIEDEIRDIAARIQTESGFKPREDAMLVHIRRNIADLVTFNTSPADQADWERAAGSEVVEDSKGESFAQVDLLELVRNFVAETANPGLFGTNFVENFPDAWQHLWKLDAAFIKMTFAPSWLPIPSVGLGRAAARQLRQHLCEFHEAMDKHLAGEEPGIKWQDLDNVSPLVKARVEVFRRANLPMEARAAADMALAWAMNANANTLVAWMIWEISRDAVLVEQIREEIALYVRVAQPINEFGGAVWLAPELEHVDVHGLLTNCPLLKVIGKPGEEQTYVLKQGTYVHCPQELHHLDPEYFADPKEFIPQRHMHETEDKQGNCMRTVRMDSMKPYTEASLLSGSSDLPLREMIIYPAVMLSLYEFVAPEGKGWTLPTTEKRAATRHPRQAMTVWVRRKKF
ncbi:hypothetical protein LMH87_003998 [Akanthomyces muscarius]|uniref:Cytochrome P450 n=1 Tax=Akanthomyces muscarius TaxID=2231603 RepID=A0A9W8UHN0_AKAMU|nr:hypothetical protein LMH87_003998 [Akanthomyces muscarius]KAJ4145139.1 hypothetical protein LMH87_003998 [Akanthomyces muscarius]